MTVRKQGGLLSPIDKVVPKYCRERYDSDKEGDIPPMELRKCIRYRECRECEETSPIPDNDSMLSEADSMETVDYDWSHYMNVDTITNKRNDVAKKRQRKAINFLNALVNMF